MIQPFHPGAFNLHTTSITDTRETAPLAALTEPRVYGLSWLSVLGQAVLIMTFIISLLFLFFFA